MNCSDFRQWLDEGRGEGGREVAAAHAAGCPACAAAEESDRALVGALSQRFASAPAGFTGAVLARLPERRPVPAFVPEPSDPYPWYVRMLLEPSTVLAVLLGGVYALWAGELWDSVRGASTDLVARWIAALAIFPSEVAVAFSWLSAALLVFGGSYLLYRLADGVGSRIFRVGRLT